MGLKLNLQFMKLRRNVNCTLVKLLAAFVYITLSAFFILRYFRNDGIGEVKTLLRGGNFVIFGEALTDPRKGNANQDVPDSLKKFEAGFVEGAGEMGRGVQLSDQERAASTEIKKTWAFNKIASDKVPLWRSLTDHRSPSCQKIKYPYDLPTTSVIIIFNNEALSALLRTVWSVLERTPKYLLHEIVLVDDGSNITDITTLLPIYIKHRLPPKVGMVRTNSQLGLIRARQEGAKAATGDVLVFLDSHCEATEGWYEPMAARIQEDQTVVQIPQIGSISAESMSFGGGGGGSVMVGGFTWSGHFTWESLPQKVRETRKSTDPAKTATMAGGLFAIQREFYWRIGGYDEGMSGWGGENLEMSFRVWRCGGSMENHPCSNVGHIFRDFHPYFIPEDSHGINTARMAEVWMDDFKRFFYMHRASLEGADIGDLKDRFAIIERLQCKSFRWFLETVYPHKYIMDEQAIAWGRIRNTVKDKFVCFDHLQKDMAAKYSPYSLGQYPCHPYLGDSQYYTVSRKGELRNEYMCANFKDNKVRMEGCNEEGDAVRRWEITNNGQIKVIDQDLCVASGNLDAGVELFLTPCQDHPNQVWSFEFYAEGYEHLKLKPKSS